MQHTPRLTSLTREGDTYTLTTDTDPAPAVLVGVVRVEVDPTPPAQPLPRLLGLTLVAEVETEDGTEHQRHTYRVDRVARAGRGVLASLGLDGLCAAEVERVTKRRRAAGLLLRYAVAGECVEWPLSAAPVHMVAGLSDGLVWLRVWYLDTLTDPSAAPVLTPPAPVADFLFTPRQYLSAAPLLVGVDP